MLHWDYKAILKAYQECRDSTCQRQLLDLMVASRAVHLVPDIIDSIGPGGFMDTECKIHTISRLADHDFSREFDTISIVGRAEAEGTKTRLHEWWMANGQRIVESRGQKDTVHAPNNWASLVLRLTTEKRQYIELEPIRLTVTIEERNDSWYTFSYRRPKAAFKLEFFQVADGGQGIKTSEIRYPDRWIICGHASRWFALPGHFAVSPDCPHVAQQWVNIDDEGLFGVGEVTLRAVLTSLYGRHKGKQLVSNDIQIKVVKPHGDDAAAHRFLTGTQPIDVGNGQKYGPEFVRHDGLVRTSSSGYRNHLDEYFVRAHGHSLYAFYVRYTQAGAARWHPDFSRNLYPPDGTYSNADVVLVARLNEIVRDAPRDFPLLADAYVMLLDYYKGIGELEKMTDVAGTIKLDDLVTVDPRLPEQLAALMEHPHEVAAGVHRKGSLGRTSLHKAVENGPPALVSFLIAKGADVNAYGNEETPLFIAAKAGRNELVEMLLAHGADINATSSGLTPLFWPVGDGRMDTVKLLLAKGAKVNVTDRSGRTPFE